MTTRVRYRTIWYGAVVVAMALFSACAPRQPSPAEARAILDTQWTLTELAGATVPQVANSQMPSLRLGPDDGRVSGHTGCNRLMGRFTLAGDQLTFPDPLATTRMACVSATGGEQERRFLEALRQSRRFTVRGTRLTLYGESGDALATLTSGP
jgi:heat shock protein HslJ